MYVYNANNNVYTFCERDYFEINEKYEALTTSDELDYMFVHISDLIDCPTNKVTKIDIVESNDMDSNFWLARDYDGALYLYYDFPVWDDFNCMWVCSDNRYATCMKIIEDCYSLTENTCTPVSIIPEIIDPFAITIF